MFHIFLVGGVHGGVRDLVVFHGVAGLIVGAALLHDGPVMAHQSRIHIDVALPIEDQGQRLIPDHAVGLIKYIDLPPRCCSKEVAEEGGVGAVGKTVKEVVALKIPIGENHRLGDIPADLLNGFCSAQFTPGIAVHGDVLRVGFHEIILVLELVLGLPPVVPFQDGNILAPTLPQHTIHISAAAYVGIPQRKDEAVRISGSIVQ